MIQTLLSAEGLSAIIFLVFIGVTLTGALIAVSSRVLIRSVSGLALCFLGVAGIYYFLNSPFVALMQVLIYIGAICVVIIFAIMLAEPEEMKRKKKRSLFVALAAAVSCAALTVAVIVVATNTEWIRSANQTNTGSVEQIGHSLLTTHSMSFELISVVLLAAIIGSLVLAQGGRNKQ